MPTFLTSWTSSLPKSPYPTMTCNNRRRIAKDLISLPTSSLSSSTSTTSTCTSPNLATTSITNPSSPTDLSPQLHRALHHISTELSRKSIHLTYILHPPTTHTPAVLIPTAPLLPRTTHHLSRILQKAHRQNLLVGTPWIHSFITATLPPPPTPDSSTEVIRRSLLQSIPLFSSESLTLLAVDCVYALKLRIAECERVPHHWRQQAINLAVHQLSEVRHWYAPLVWDWLVCVYPSLTVGEWCARDVNDGFVRLYGEEGLVFGTGCRRVDSTEEVISAKRAEIARGFQIEEEEKVEGEGNKLRETMVEWGRFLDEKPGRKLVAVRSEPQVLAMSMAEVMW